MNSSGTHAQDVIVHARQSLTDLPSLLSVDETAAFLRVGRSSAYQFARMHGVRIGRLLRVPREALARTSAG